jgi:hypothetical protein
LGLSGGVSEDLPQVLRSRTSLNGEWTQYIDGQYIGQVIVPSSQHPIGLYGLKRSFLLPKLPAGNRVFVHFEAITYKAKVSINERELGDMGPYLPYEFEFTDYAREGKNDIEVLIADLAPMADGTGKDEIALGVNLGWEAYGGIIRDVYVEVRQSTYIENVRFAYDLAADYSRAHCTARVYCSSLQAASGSLKLSLIKNGEDTTTVQKDVQLHEGQEAIEVVFEASHPSLWSPGMPHLYQLRCSLNVQRAEDTWEQRTGFRRVAIDGRRFLLNGENLVLQGVCRHDVWKDQGFTLTRAQREQDMRMIKALGCNYVRLCHYPHDRHIVELADELGLFVTEEPGYWIVNFQTMVRGEIELGYSILERMIQRDWNSPAVFGWLLSNESKLTPEILREGKARCNEMDPLRRPVSAANSRPKEEYKAIFESGGMDFFDQHTYTFDMTTFETEADFYGASRPLTFTEWGGKAIGQSQALMADTVDSLLDLVEAGKLAGHSFWSWMDVREYTRGDAEMEKGVLQSGVVTESREPRPEVYMELERLMEGRRHVHVSGEMIPERIPFRSITWSGTSEFAAIPLDEIVNSAAGKQGWAQFEARMAAFWAKSPFGWAKDQWQLSGNRFCWWKHELTDPLSLAGLPVRLVNTDGFVRPLMVNQNATAEIPIAIPFNHLHILGHIAFPQGYPVQGRHGEVCAVYRLKVASGKDIEIPLRWGYEIVQGNRIYGASRINPIAIGAQPVLHFVKDIAREDYQILLYSTQAIPAHGVLSLTCEVRDKDLSMAIFAITTERLRP